MILQKLNSKHYICSADKLNMRERGFEGNTMNYKIYEACKRADSDVQIVDTGSLYSRLIYTQTMPSESWYVSYNNWSTAEINDVTINVQNRDSFSVPYEIIDSRTVKLIFDESLAGTAVFVFRKP